VYTLISAYIPFIDNPRKPGQNNHKKATRIEDFKHMVGVVSIINGETLTCSANISPSLNIITAAHCIFGAELVTLTFGTVNLFSPCRTVNVTNDRIHVHPGYTNEYPYTHNIAVIQIQTNFKIDSKIAPIKMHEPNFVAKQGSNYSMLGYLATDNHLRLFDGSIAQFDACRHSYFQYQSFHFGNTSQVLQEDWQL
ncbi:uncharacterized protein LOC116351282, partial [Contarinia nasturtii]|uniref:uncharacterized protein LOC116351282 n=1 Tax=Contarinia nasturtii TaxID=265458 RepID=UPI0012D476FE